MLKPRWFPINDPWPSWIAVLQTAFDGLFFDDQRLEDALDRLERLP